MILWLFQQERRRSIMDYFRGIALLLEKIGAHPRTDADPDWVQMVQHAGWRPFIVERHPR